jgi:hypothetical protein
MIGVYMNKSEQIGALAKALGESQKAMNGAYKDSKNPFFKSSYADLKQVMQVFQTYYAPNGLAVSQLVGQDGIETILMHESGQWVSSVCALPIAKANDPQAMGSSISYMRRYSLSAVLGVYQTDDDGEAAMERPDYRTLSPTHQPIPSKIENKPVQPVVATQPLTGDPGALKIEFGKFKGKLVSEVAKQDLKDYVLYLEDQSKLKEVPIQGQIREFVVAARAYAGM